MSQSSDGLYHHFVLTTFEWSPPATPAPHSSSDSPVVEIFLPVILDPMQLADFRIGLSFPRLELQRQRVGTMTVKEYQQFNLEMVLAWGRILLQVSPPSTILGQLLSSLRESLLTPTVFYKLRPARKIIRQRAQDRLQYQKSFTSAF